MNKLIKPYEDTIFDSSLSDSVQELAELGIDSLIDNDIVKSIPIVQTIFGIVKTSQNLYERNLVKQTLNFIKGFNEKELSEDTIIKHRAKLEIDRKFAEEELGRIILILNSTIDAKKSEILGLLYNAYVNEKLSWEEFQEMSEITNRVFLTDLELLKDIYRNKISNTTQCDAHKADRLISLGLIHATMMNIMISNINGAKTDRYLEMNDLGILYCKIGLKCE